MKPSTLSFTRKAARLLLLLLIMTSLSKAQVRYQAKDNLSLTINGTSTLHDWSMTASKGSCDATFTLTPAGQIASLTSLNFSMPAEGLKSDHSSMDKNAYKSLKTDKNANISYVLTGATVAPDGTIKCTGRLTIAGAGQNTELVAVAKVNANGTITVKGSKKISMKEFSIDPPSFMMGAVKTGNDITLQFTLTLTK